MLVFLLFSVFVAFVVAALSPVQSASHRRDLQTICVNACPRSRHADFLRAIVCGDRSTAQNESAFFRGDFEKTGLVHLIVVSGTHLILLEAIVTRLLPSRGRDALILSVLVLFTLMSGASPPILRACLAWSLRFLSARFGLNWTRVQVLTMAGFLSLTICTSSNDLTSVFLGWIAALAFEFGFSLGSKKLINEPSLGERLLHLRESTWRRFRANVAVYFALVPALLPMGVPSLFSILSNLFLAPVLALVLFPASCLAFVCHPLTPFIDFLWDGVLWIVHEIASLTPDAWQAVIISPLALIPYLFTLTLFFSWKHRQRHRLRPRAVSRIAVGLSFIFLSPLARADELIVWNIGQGSWATLKSERVCQHFDMGGEWLPRRAIEEVCENKANEVFYSHWDWDHIGLTREALKMLPNLCVEEPPGGPAPNRFKASLISNLPRCEEKSRADEIFLSHLNSAQAAKLHDANDFSRVFVEDRVIFPGDSPKKEEKIWRLNAALRSARILIAGHHGSKTATSEELLASLPHVKMIIASAHYSRYGHPHPAMLARAKKFELPVIRTEDWGSLHFDLGEPDQARKPSSAQRRSAASAGDDVTLNGSSKLGTDGMSVPSSRRR